MLLPFERAEPSSSSPSQLPPANASAAWPEEANAATEQQQQQQVLDLNALQAAREGYFRHSPAVSVILTAAYTIVFAVGIIGNSFVVAIVCKSPRMRTVTNFFIANLAFADILVLLFCLPATLVGNLFIPYVLGLFVCKTVSYLQGVAVSASINTMVAVTLDRFLAICFPMDWHMSRRTARWTIASIWLFSLTISLPWAVFFTLQPYALEQRTIYVCAEAWPSERWGTTYFVVANLILLYLFPLVVITFCYLGIWYKIERRHIPGERSRGLKIELIMQRSKLKVVKMMMVVVVIFLLSWLPLYLIFARIKLAEERSQWEEALITKMMPLAQWLGASNSCINPILYTFFNRKYKRGFLDLLRYGLCCGGGGAHQQGLGANRGDQEAAGQHLEAGCTGDQLNGSAGCPTSSNNQSHLTNLNNFSAGSSSNLRAGAQLKMDTLRHHQRHSKQMRMQSMQPARGSLALGALVASAAQLGEAPDASPRARALSHRKKSIGNEPTDPNGGSHELGADKLEFANAGGPTTARQADGKQQQQRRRRRRRTPGCQTNHKTEDVSRTKNSPTKPWSSTPSSLNSSTSSRGSANKSTPLTPPRKSLGATLSQATPGANASAGTNSEGGGRRRSLVWGRRKTRCKSLGSKSTSTSTSTNTTRDTELTDVTALSSATRLADLDEPPPSTSLDEAASPGGRRASETGSDNDDIEESCAYIDDDDDDDVDDDDNDGAIERHDEEQPTTAAPDNIPAKQPPYGATDYAIVRCVGLATPST